MSTFIKLDSKYRNRQTYSNPADYFVSANQTSGWSDLIRDTQCVKPCVKKEACNMLYCIKLLKLVIPTRIVDASGDTIEYLARDPYNQPLRTNTDLVNVRLSTERYTDDNLVRTIENKQKDITFVAKPCHIFISEPEFGYLAPPNQAQIDTGNIVRERVEFSQYYSDMSQCIRFQNLKPEIKFRIFTNQDQSTDGDFVNIIGGNNIPGFNKRSNSVRIYGDDLNSTTLPISYLQTQALFEITPYVRDGSYENHVVSLWEG